MAYREEIPAARLARQVGKGARGRIALDAAADDLERRIKAAAPEETGRLKRSIKVEAVLRTANPRLIVTTAGAPYGEYQEHGTPHLRARRYIRDTAAGDRLAWEATGRRALESAQDRNPGR